jgi:hypothetical protein
MMRVLYCRTVSHEAFLVLSLVPFYAVLGNIGLIEDSVRSTANIIVERVGSSWMIRVISVNGVWLLQRCVSTSMLVRSTMLVVDVLLFQCGGSP